MKLLFLTPQLPYPPHQGTSIRNLNVIRGLASRHVIDLLTFGDRAALGASPLCTYCRRVELANAPTRSLLKRAIETLVSPLPDMARRLDSPALSARLAETLTADHYDVIQLEGIEMAPFWEREVKRQNAVASTEAAARPRAVFDDHNAEYVLQRTAFEADRKRAARWHAALYSHLQWQKLAHYERDLCLAVDAVAAVSQKDSAALTALDPRIKPVVIPNGVDVQYYLPSTGVSARPLAEVSTVFTGKMDFRPNVDAAVWFAEEILPSLRHQIPLAHVSFVGQKPSARVRALIALPGVHITGWVADTRPYIADAAVYVVPLRMGGGTRLKVLEAMAMGKAIVSTTLGAEGIDCVPGRDLLLADEAGEFAQAVAALIQSPERRLELGAHARRLVEDKYDWAKLVPHFEDIYSRFDTPRTNVL